MDGEDHVAQRVVCDISVSADGFVAGPGQSQEKPLGEGPAERLHSWMFDTPEENAEEVTRITAAGAFVMGRNMFGPVRGEWTGDWRGWWGDDPPYHAPVFVLTHHPHPSIEMQGGTTFHFVTDGFDAAYEQAIQAAHGRGVDIAGGASTVRQALNAGVVDELVLDIVPVLLGEGERQFDGVRGIALEPFETLHSP